MKRTALVTGASSGIGEELARCLAADGWDLVLVARSGAKLESLAGELATKHGAASIVLAEDLNDRAAPARIAATLTARGAAIDALINNAGFGTVGPFAEGELDNQLEMVEVNIAALTRLTRLFLPAMVERRRGQVLNVASTAAFQPGPMMAVYYASKAYVLSFSEALADELRFTGVTVTALCPGPTASGFAAVAGSEKSRLFRARPPMSSAAVAAYGYRAMLRGRRVAVPGLINKLLAQAVRISPRRLVTAITRRLQENA
jgi:short-subunit dehydrogenase